MSGSSIVRELLATNPKVTALVPPDIASSRLVVGQLKLGVKLPAISVQPVSSNEQWTTARNLQTKMIRERIQVTVWAATFGQMEQVLKACSLGQGVHTGIVKGYKVRSVMPDAVGPYLGPAGDEIHEQSRDFMVTFMEAN